LSGDGVGFSFARVLELKILEMTNMAKSAVLYLFFIFFLLVGTKMALKHNIFLALASCFRSAFCLWGCAAVFM